MNRTRKIQTVLAIVTGLFVLITLAYSQYHALSKADFVSSTLNFENTDQEKSLSLVHHGKAKLADSDGYMTVILPQIDLFDHIFCSSTRTHLNDQKALVLRC